jgi:hypothetical protein
MWGLPLPRMMLVTHGSCLINGTNAQRSVTAAPESKICLSLRNMPGPNGAFFFVHYHTCQSIHSSTKVGHWPAIQGWLLIPFPVIALIKIVYSLHCCIENLPGCRCGRLARGHDPDCWRCAYVLVCNLSLRRGLSAQLLLKQGRCLVHDKAGQERQPKQ